MAQKISLTRYLVEQQRDHGHIPSQLRLLLEVVARCCKTISHAVNKGDLGDVMGSASTENVQGEVQKKLDIIANDVLIEANEWEQIERGLIQRITALNMFIDDVYHDQKIIKDGIIPEALIYSGKCFLPPCVGLNPPRGVWCHITGTDLVRDSDGQFYVLEDNCRTPSGVSLT